MGKKLYVGNLSYSVIQTDLEEWFTKYGKVQSAQIVEERYMEHSTRFGLVEMDTDAQAQAAIKGLDDQEHEGRLITVNEAKPWEVRSGGFVGGSIDGNAASDGGDYAGNGRQD